MLLSYNPSDFSHTVTVSEPRLSDKCPSLLITGPDTLENHLTHWHWAAHWIALLGHWQ